MVEVSIRRCSGSRSCARPPFPHIQTTHTPNKVMSPPLFKLITQTSNVAQLPIGLGLCTLILTFYSFSYHHTALGPWGRPSGGHGAGRLHRLLLTRPLPTRPQSFGFGCGVVRGGGCKDSGLQPFPWGGVHTAVLTRLLFVRKRAEFVVRKRAEFLASDLEVPAGGTRPAARACGSSSAWRPTADPPRPYPPTNIFDYSVK